jgi:hypothetical protein
VAVAMLLSSSSESNKTTRALGLATRGGLIDECMSSMGTTTPIDPATSAGLASLPAAAVV